MKVSHKAFGDLAILGGTPAFSEKLHVGRPNIGDRDRLMERINDILDRRWLTNAGVYVREFERRVAEMVGVRHCIAMCNGTVALEIAIRSLGLKGEVIVPSFTFIATAHSLQWQEITPVFCDVDPQTHNIDPEQVERLITPRTSGIIGVHVWGRPCDVERLEWIARKHQLGLLYDAAHAFACSHNGRMIGSFGNAEVYSFHATKFMNTFEGGAIVTNDDDLAARIRLMKNFGFAGTDKVIYIGTNGKMCEVSAAMGLTSLDSLDEFIAVNRRNHGLYQRGLADAPGLDLVVYNDADKCNYQYVAVVVDPDVLQLSRDELVKVLAAENVLARRYFYPGCHQMEPYRSYFPNAGLLLPHTESLTKRVLCLPTGTTIDPEMIGTVCHILRLAVTHPGEVHHALSNTECSQTQPS
ncbi:MAG: DegT/DnrJ/EryC1/StrS family aminotransferase [Phycisphaerales bacterium]